MTKAKTVTKKPMLVSTSPFTTHEQEIRTLCLTASATLVSNPVHAFAATPQNVMQLANVFYHFVKGIDLPASTKLDESTKDTAVKTEKTYG